MSEPYAPRLVDRQWDDAYARIADLEAQLATAKERIGELEKQKREDGNWHEGYDNLLAQNHVLESELAALRDEVERLRLGTTDRKWMDVTPDDDLPTRILSAYIDEDYWSDNTVGASPENPVVIAMNEHREQRNVILRLALETLKRKHTPLPDREAPTKSQLRRIAEQKGEG